MIRKIVFGTNFTSLSRKALDYTIELAKKTGGKLIGAYALQPPMPVYSLTLPDTEYRKELQDISRSKLQEFFQQVNGEVEIETRLCIGAPGQELSKLARKEKAGLIVVAKHSRSRLERFFIASTTERILREARTPVLVVPDVGLQSVKWDPLICAVDFSDPSLEALKFAIQLARDYRSDLVVIHVLELGPAMKTLGEKSRAKLAALPEKVRKKLADVVSTLGAPYGTHTVVAEGKPPEVLLEEATRLDSDLLIVGKQGNTLLDRITVGSTSSAVMRGAHLPVVLVPGYRVRSVSRS